MLCMVILTSLILVISTGLIFTITYLDLRETAVHAATPQWDSRCSFPGGGGGTSASYLAGLVPPRSLGRL